MRVCESSPLSQHQATEHTLLAVNSSGPTLPQVAAGSPDVDIGVRHAARHAHVAHALELHVLCGVADFIAVRLPLIAGVKGQVVAPDVALSHHPSLLLRASFHDLHVAMPAGLEPREESVQSCLLMHTLLWKNR